eukprot:3456211-Amphidinium_carterae.1
MSVTAPKRIAVSTSNNLIGNTRCSIPSRSRTTHKQIQKFRMTGFRHDDYCLRMITMLKRRTQQDETMQYRPGQPTTPCLNLDNFMLGHNDAILWSSTLSCCRCCSFVNIGIDLARTTDTSGLYKKDVDH